MFLAVASAKTSSASFMFVEHKNCYQFLLVYAIRLTLILARSSHNKEFVSTFNSNLDTYSMIPNSEGSKGCFFFLGDGGGVFLTSYFIISFHKLVYAFALLMHQTDRN